MNKIVSLGMTQTDLAEYSNSIRETEGSEEAGSGSNI